VEEKIPFFYYIYKMKNKPAQQILKKYFGFDSFLDPQEKIINHVLSGKHSLVIMPTGSGKSLTYQAPALMLDDLTVVYNFFLWIKKRIKSKIFF